VRLGNDLFDLAIDGKASNGSLGEDQFVVDKHIELTGAPGLNRNVGTKAGFERIGQTGRAGAIASRHAIENLDRHS